MRVRDAFRLWITHVIRHYWGVIRRIAIEQIEIESLEKYKCCWQVFLEASKEYAFVGYEIFGVVDRWDGATRFKTLVRRKEKSRLSGDISRFRLNLYMRAGRTMIAPNAMKPGVTWVTPQVFPAGFGPVRCFWSESNARALKSINFNNWVKTGMSIAYNLMRIQFSPI